MDGMLSPAIRLMGRLGYLPKFSLIFLLFLIPLGSLGFHLLASTGERLEALERQRQGLVQLGELAEGRRALMEARDLSAARLHLPALPGDPRAARERLQRSAAPSGWSEGLALGEGEAVMEGLAPAVEALTAAVGRVAADSGLILADRREAYRLTDLATTRLPALAEALSQLRGYGAVVAGWGRWSPERFVGFQQRHQRLEAALADLRPRAERLFAADAAFRAPLQPLLDELESAVADYLTLARERILEPDRIGVDGIDFFNRGTAALERAARFDDELLARFDAHLAQREAALAAQRNLQLAVSVAVLLLLLYLFAGFYRGVRDSVARLAETADALAAGDLTARTQLTARDELAEVAERFNGMAEQVARLVRGAHASTDELAEFSTDLHREATAAGERVELQRRRIDEVASAVTEMAASVQEVAGNAGHAAEAAEGAHEEVGRSAAIITDNIETIRNLADEVQRAAEVIGALNEEARTIGSVLDVISGIAEQTNLLALNAAIEAARAGEQGRGFAVVADEVRGLAGRSQRSVAEIQAMIERLQGITREAVTVMERGKERADAGVEGGARAGEALERITRAIATISRMGGEISGATAQQREVTGEIERSLVAISDVARTAADEARRTTEGSENIAGLADRLRGEVARFRF